MLAPPSTSLRFLQRSVEVEAGRSIAVAAGFLFLFGFLPLPFGSLVTLPGHPARPPVAARRA